MYQEVTYTELKHLVDTSSTIVWVGTTVDNVVLIKLHESIGNTYKIVQVRLATIPQIRNPIIVEHVEATEGTKQFTGVIWQRSGWLSTLRQASIHGINIGGSCEPGLDNMPRKVPTGCIMGYDIETSQLYTRNGSFVPKNARITSLSIWCTCGSCKAWTTIPHADIPNMVYCVTSSTLVKKFIEYVVLHSPLWLVGYNCYNFDNSVLGYHCPTKYRPLFRSINTGAKSAAGFSFYIDIIGVNNIDLYTYLDKRLRWKYTALSLGSVAEYHKLGFKMEMPTTYDADTVYDLILYNINDSKITAKLLDATGVLNQVIGLCTASCSPMVDCNRYVSGTMASCAASSFCISRGMIMDWSQCDLRIGYEGGIVLEPIKGLHKYVTVVDFSSMYPTIIIDVGISPENITILDSCSKGHDDKLVDYDDNYTICCIRGKVVKFNKKKDCLSRDVLRVTTRQRTKYKLTDADYADAYKCLGNSFYGAYGFANSPMHSPRCAAAVTLMGRTATALAYTVFTGLGLKVVYGDTDSCMLRSGPTTKHFKGGIDAHIDFALDTFHRIISYTPFPSMRMAREEPYKSILLVDKKHYAYMKMSGKVGTKGLSSTRKDRLGICRHMTKLVSEIILSSTDIEDTRAIVSNLLNICYSHISSGLLDMQSISREVRYEGNTCYRYTNNDGEDINVPVAKVNLDSAVDYDAKKVYKSLESDMNKLCIPAGLGNVKQMISDADILFYD